MSEFQDLGSIRYLSVPVPDDIDTAAANAIWVRHVLRIAEQRGISLDRLGASGTGREKTPVHRRRGPGIDEERGAPPRPTRTTGTAQFTALLTELHRWAGAPSMRYLEEVTGDTLPRSSINEILRGKQWPSFDHLSDFVNACEADEVWPAWRAAWKRLDAAVAAERTPALLGNATVHQSRC